MYMFSRSIQKYVTLVALFLLPSLAIAGEAPEKPIESGDAKVSLLFPSVSEIHTVLGAAGIQVDPSRFEIDIAPTKWGEISDEQKLLQLGSTMGYLAVASTIEDIPKIRIALEGLLQGSESLGIEESAASHEALRDVLSRIRSGSISKVKLLSLLDDLRRLGLRDISEKEGDASVAKVLAGAWLRGSSLLVRGTNISSNEMLSIVFARPELARFVNEMVEGAKEDEFTDAQVSAAAELKILTSKSTLGKEEVERFAELADKVLG